MRHCVDAPAWHLPGGLQVDAVVGGFNDPLKRGQIIETGDPRHGIYPARVLGVIIARRGTPCGPIHAAIGGFVHALLVEADVLHQGAFPIDTAEPGKIGRQSRVG